MNVTARFYGHLQLQVGRRQINLDLPEHATLRLLVEEMDRQLGEQADVSFLPFRGDEQEEQPTHIEKSRYNMLILVNGHDQQFLDGLDTCLQDGAEVDFLPPLAGGASTLNRTRAISQNTPRCFC
jgi:molybdopterin converting factor small subunit